MSRLLFVLLSMVFGGAAYAELVAPQFLFEAARLGDPRWTSELISQGEDVNQRDQYNNTPLHYVADPARMIPRGRYNDYNIRSPKLSWSYNQNYPEVARVLIENGADVDAKNEFGETPLLLATISNPDVSKILIEHGASEREKHYAISIGGMIYACLTALVVRFFYIKAADESSKNYRWRLKEKDVIFIVFCISLFVIMLEINFRIDFWTRSVLFDLYEFRFGHAGRLIDEYDTFLGCEQAKLHLEAKQEGRLHCIKDIKTDLWMALNIFLSLLLSLGIVSLINESILKIIFVVNAAAIIGLFLHTTIFSDFLMDYWDPFDDKFKVEALGKLWVQIIVSSNIFSILAIILLAALHRSRPDRKVD